jgi:hypothetical protein
VAALTIMAALGGCASVISGTSQTLTLDTIPSGADCSLSKKGLVVGRVNPTPGAVFVQRTRDDITVECKKDGYQTGTFINRSGLEAATFGNVILGGLVGVVVDAASGANNKYDEKMHITLAQIEPGQPNAPPAGALSEPIEFRCPSPGTTIKTSTGSQLRFGEANGLRCAYTDENGAKREQNALFSDAVGRLSTRELERLWPMKVGTIVTFNLMDNTPKGANDRLTQRSYEETFIVTRQERVTVPAGAFDTFVIEWREKGVSVTNKTEALITLWYAPRLGYVVKSTAQPVDADARDPYAMSIYEGMKYEATEIAMPNGETLPVAAGGTEKSGGTPAASPATATPASASPADRLKALNDLRDQKLITPEEYETRRKAILGEL